MSDTTIERDLLCSNVTVNAEGHLCFARRDVAELAEKYGTPLYLMDEDRIRERCRTYTSALYEALGENARAAYASKAASFKEIYRIAADEKMCVDVVSCGEIATASAAGFPLGDALFHSNNKTDEDISFAMDRGIGYFVVDNAEELTAINAEAARRNTAQKVLLRLTPGIDPHTFAAVSTGKVDSKFGSAIETGQAKEITEYALSLPHVDLCGYHCHIGSQVFGAEVYLRAADVMLTFIAKMRDDTGFTARVLDLGGGFAVRYLPSDPEVDIAGNIREIGSFIKEVCADLSLPVPTIILEPGRSIVADAGMTLYTAGTVKRIPEFVNYVSVDGGMTDNVRYAMYKSPYTVLAANRMNERCDMTANVVGRCCESGDIIQERVSLPSSVRRGDLIACLTTGAYNYSMASNYNRIPRPPIVMLKDGVDRVVVRRESAEDLLSLDI